MMGTFMQDRCDLEDVHYVGNLNTKQDGNQGALFTVSHDGTVGFAFCVFVCPFWMRVLEQCSVEHRIVTLRNVRGGTSLHVTPESQIEHIVPSSSPKKARQSSASPMKKKSRPPRDDAWVPE